MVAALLTGTVGIILLIVIILVILTVTVFALYAYKNKNDKKAKIRAIHHKYSMIDNRSDINTSIGVKSNIIQPPYKHKIKVNVLTPQENNKKQKIEYDSDNEKEIFLEKEREEEQYSFEKSMASYKEKFIDLFTTSKTIDIERCLSRPDLIDISDAQRPQMSRLPRPDSIYDAYEDILGRLLFTLNYSQTDEFLTVHLISGRNIYTGDDMNVVRMPAVSLFIEGQPDSEVTSTPDEAPNPEYDQEFTFPLQVNHIFRVVLRFIVWDVISNHESSVVGFIRLRLSSHQKLLINNIDNGPIAKEIKPSLNESLCYMGELEISLLYDCVTDKINVNIRRARNLAINEDDTDLYIKISLLLDNDVIQSKRSGTFSSARNININQSFEFNALSVDLDKVSNDSPSSRVADELLLHTTEASKMSLSITSKRSVQNNANNLISETLRQNMGILFSLRASTCNRNKRVLGRLYLGKTNVPINDEDFHWGEMVKNFDNLITQWHQLKLDRF